MPKNLSDALDAAKKNRNILSKTIIWESGVSKTQFYRIINGTEAPSSESKRLISKSLEIDCEQFDLLHSYSESEPNAKDKKIEFISTSQLSQWVGILALCAFLVGLTVLFANNSPLPNSTIANDIVVSHEDSTLFISDVTIPDGTAIAVNTQYEKTWRVKNTGKLVWKDRYLMRTTPASRLLCSSPSMVPIPETLPGETVDITVIFMTPHLPGSCRTDWKASDKNGNLYFPKMHGLFSIVTVVVE